MPLQTYRAKRDFKQTPEPRGERQKRSGHSFVIQKHAASHLHYDFRLELDGVLLSWAVPKGPSMDPADRRLAMQVEDHPVEYGGFEGTIPKGQYGGGTVMLWDRGTWAPIGDPHAGLAKGHLKFELQGEKLAGAWNLVRTHGSKYGGKGGDRAWLLIKEKDAHAHAGEPIVETAPDSVASGRDLDAIATAGDHTWRSDQSVAQNVKAGAVAAAPSKKAAAKKPVKSATTKAPAKPAAKAPTTKAAATSGAKTPRASPPAPATLPGARKAAMPKYIAPMLCTLVGEAPTGDDWIHEIKYDGYRMVVAIERGRARLYSRNEKEWTTTFPDVARDLGTLAVDRAWIDGEVVVLDAQGRTSFQSLQNALAVPKAKGLAFFAFDVMYLDGVDVREAPLARRKELLRALVGDGVGCVRVGPEVAGRGDEFFAQACKLGLEGAIAKRADSTYASGARNGAWRKIKCIQRQEMVIGGYTEPQGSRTGFGALLIGYYDDGKLRYAGKVGTGFDDRTLRSLMQSLATRERKSAPFADPPRGYEAKGAHWVTPDLVAEIAFTEWSRDGALRHPSFQGLRPDKKAEDVVREKPLTVSKKAGVAKGTEAEAEQSTRAPAKPAKQSAAPRKKAVTTDAAKAPVAAKTPSGPAKATRAKGAVPSVAVPTEIAGITLSNPGKLYFPEDAITKGELAAYYAAVAPYLLPHIEGRPLSLVRCPDGWQGQCFYQKHAAKAVNAAADRVEVPEGKGTATYLSASSAAGIVSLVQWGVIEMHPWGSRTPRLTKPDRLIFDFDPDPDVSYDELVKGVQLLRTLLDEMGLTGFLKTTGGKGLHIVVPVRPTLEWPEAKAFAKAVADFMVRTFPDRFIATASKEQRKGLIFLDYLRNAEGATAVAPYAVRARAHAPVAMPIAWEELAQDVRGEFFNVRNAMKRLTAAKSDPWRNFFTVKQSITAAMRKRLA